MYLPAHHRSLAAGTRRPFRDRTAATARSRRLTRTRRRPAILPPRTGRVHVLASTVTYGAVLREAGLVECTGRGEVVLGARDGGTSETADEAGRAFSTAGIETTVTDDSHPDPEGYLCKLLCRCPEAAAHIQPFAAPAHSAM